MLRFDASRCHLTDRAHFLISFFFQILFCTCIYIFEKKTIEFVLRQAKPNFLINYLELTNSKQDKYSTDGKTQTRIFLSFIFFNKTKQKLFRKKHKCFS
jgi:hypothetical protein